jgi:hypothetical protein
MFYVYPNLRKMLGARCVCKKRTTAEEKAFIDKKSFVASRWFLGNAEEKKLFCVFVDWFWEFC